MLKLGAFESSLRGGPDTAPAPRTKKQLLQLHHRSCSGEAHGCGIEKQQTKKPKPCPGCCRHAAGGPPRSASNGSELSDATDSGHESLSSPLHSARPPSALSADDPDHVCPCTCTGETFGLSVAERLHSAQTLSSAAKSPFYDPAVESEDVASSVEDMAEESSGLRRQLPEDPGTRLSLRRKKRNQRTVEHVDGATKGLAVNGSGTPFQRTGLRGSFRGLGEAKVAGGDAVENGKPNGTPHGETSFPRVAVLRASFVRAATVDDVPTNGDGPFQRGGSGRGSFGRGGTGRSVSADGDTAENGVTRGSPVRRSLVRKDKDDAAKKQQQQKEQCQPPPVPEKPSLSRSSSLRSQDGRASVKSDSGSSPTKPEVPKKPSKLDRGRKGDEEAHRTPRTPGVRAFRAGVAPPPPAPPPPRKPLGRTPGFRPGRRPSAGPPPVPWEELWRQSLGRRAGSGNPGLYKSLDELDKARSEEQLASERAWLEAERLWLLHRGGFTACRRLPSDASPPASPASPATNGLDVNGDPGAGKVRVRIEASGDTLVVDEDDVEKANPPQFDRVEDLSQLRYLNEASALHTLRQRFGSNLTHTYAGGSMVVVNPMAPLAIYSEKVVHMFRGCKSEDMPPHIYAVAQSAYQSMLQSRRDSSVVFLGRSGSGKTTNFRHVLQYLVLAAGAVNKVVTVEKLNAIGTVLESFGNCRTVLNSNATRFTQIFSLDFDQSGQIASASLQTLLVERTRVARRPQGEPTFHIFYRLLAGAEGSLRKELFLDNAGAEQNLFMSPLQKHEDKQKALLDFTRVQGALEVLGVSISEAKVLWYTLAAIYHLGVAGAVKVGNSSSSRWQFANPRSAQYAAHLLGTTVEELARILFGQGQGGVGTPSTPRTPFRTPSPTDRANDREVTGMEALEGLVTGLYGEVFNAVAALINRSISAPIHTVSSLVVVDTPGFQNPASCGQQGGASFEDLCHNYLQERLQLLFHHTMLVAPRDRYIQEHIDVNLDEGEGESCSPQRLVAMMDRAAQSAVVRSSQTDLRQLDRRGLLWLLDEEAVQPGASDEGFLERMFNHYGDREHQLLLRKAPGNNQFILQHLQGTNPVLYTATGWLKVSRENPIARCAATLLQESSKEDVAQLFTSIRGTGVSSTLGGSVVGIEGTQSLRRASSIRRTFTTGTAGIKRKSVCLQVKFTVDGLIDTLRRTKLNFVHCFLPQHNGGTSDVKGGSLTRNMANMTPEEALINVPLIRSQFRGAQLLDAMRLYKQGFPRFMPLSEFQRRFRLLAPSEGRPSSPVLDERRAVEDMLLGIDIDATSYRIGLSQIFFRSGVLPQLEAQRDERLTDHVVQFQAHCRGYLARRKLAKIKVQDMAVRCIQRNVRKFLMVRDWPWWRLLIRVVPLLNVHRTEEQLRLKTEELEALRVKVEALEQDRNHLKHDNDRLEAKLSEMTADLAEEHSTATLATERLEAETSERLRLEKELQDVQHQNKNLSQQGERLEMELLCMRAADMNGVLGSEEDDEEGEGDSGVYKQRYERAMRELEFTRRRLQQQHEDDLEQLVALKKQLEKKLADAYEEVEEQRQVVAQWKRKVQKLNADTNDLRLLLEEQNSRNNLLEKKQRKFDSELQLLQDELRAERQQHERVSREKEIALAEKYTLEQNLSGIRLELELKEDRVNSLTQELDELMFGGKTEEEVAHLKKNKHELEKKVKEQEEELDDLAAQVQLLEQSKLRLEMALEQQRKETRRELAQRDEELEDVRCNAQKKVKALEAQLESEHDERTQLLRERHELERRLASLEEQCRASRFTDEDTLQRLRRDLKRTKALLRDAQTMLERARGESPNKTVIRQLRNQLEDTEAARAAAVKARQAAEMELTEVQSQLEEVQRSRQDADDRASAAARERSELQSQLEENEEELAEVLKKYRAAVQQLSVDQMALQEQAGRVAELESERASLREQLAELGTRLETMETMGDPSSSLAQKRLELRAKELESKLELEQTTRSRLEVQIARLKENVEKLQEEVASLRAREASAAEAARRVQRQLREARDAAAAASARDAEAQHRRKELEKRAEAAEAEAGAARADLRLALARIEDLQAAMQGDLEDSSNSDPDRTESDHDSDGSDESINTFLANHKVRVNSSPRSNRPSLDLDVSSRSLDSPSKKVPDGAAKESFA